MKPESNHWMGARLRLALLKESAAYRTFWEENHLQKISTWEEYIQFQAILSKRPEYAFQSNQIKAIITNLPGTNVSAPKCCAGEF